MPWASNASLPDQVKGSLPAAAQTRFRQVANAALARGASDESAIRQAWHVVKQGWKKDKDGNWVRKFYSEIVVEKYDPEQLRAPAGAPESHGGEWISEYMSYHEGHPRERYDFLKKEWTRINDELLSNLHAPDSPETRALLAKQMEMVKAIHALQIDYGDLDKARVPGGTRDVVIVGAGPGGLSAAIAAGTEGLDTLVIEANMVPGGQAKHSSRIENFPGFPVGVTGEELTGRMFEQAERTGAETMLGVKVTGMEYDYETGTKTLTLSNGQEVSARAVILAGGLEFATTSFPGSEGPGVIYADGNALRKATVGASAVVVGGSNGAAQAALGVAKTSEHVYLLSRSPIDKNMSDYQVRACRDHPKITVIENDAIDRLERDSKGAPATVWTKDGLRLPAKAVGMFIGGGPTTKWLPESIRSKSGRIQTNNDLRTAIPGVLAVGDIRDGAGGRIITAAGEGQIAVRNLFGYLESEHPRWPKGDPLGRGGKFKDKPGVQKVQDQVVRKAKDRKSIKEFNQLVDQLLALDLKNPWLGQTLEEEEVRLDKRGARHSRGDVAMLQSIHDHSVELGASCGEMQKSDQQFELVKVDKSLGLVFGWAIISKKDGADYYDLNIDRATGERVPEHIPEATMLEAAADFMENSRVAKDMHEGKEQGTFVFAFPLTTDIAKAMGIRTRVTGLMVAMKPNPKLLDKFASGELKGFSIGGSKLNVEDIEIDDAA